MELNWVEPAKEVDLKSEMLSQFYRIYKGYINISQFEEWLYNTQEIETVFGDDFYFSLLDLDYRSKHVRIELDKLIEPVIPFGELEHIRICDYLHNLIVDKGDMTEILGELYDDYCRGYSFLRYVALTYIIGIYDEFDSSIELPKDIKPKIVKEAKRLLSFLQDGKIKIIGENDYSDYRKEEEQIELYNIENMFDE